MASSENVSSSFCLFCYRSIEGIAKLSNSPEKIKRFHEFLTRFVGSSSLPENKILTKNCTNDLFQTCEECTFIIDSFTEIYHQIKCLELELDLKLDKLVSGIKLSNRIPTRWTSVNKALQLTYQDDMETIMESRNEIRTVRQRITDAALRRLSKSLPRISMRRLPLKTSNEVDEPLIDLNFMTEDKIDDHMQITCDPADDPLTCQDDPNEIYGASLITLSTTIGSDPLGQSKLKDPAIPIPKDDTQIPSHSSSNTYISIVPREVTCRICQRQILCSRQKHHYTHYHDVSQMTNHNHVEKCKEDGCSAYFIKKRQLLEHRKVQHVEVDKASIANIDGVQYFQCKTCKTPFESIVFLRRHLASTQCQQDGGKQDDKSVKCLECRITFKKKQDLWLHQNQVHSFGKEKVCPKCGKSFNKTWNYKIHMEYHKGPAHWKWECGQCKKKFATVNQLKRHEKSHLKESLPLNNSSKRKAVDDDSNLNGERNRCVEKANRTSKESMEISNKEESNCEVQANDVKEEQGTIDFIPSHVSNVTYHVQSSSNLLVSENVDSVSSIFINQDIKMETDD